MNPKAAFYAFYDLLRISYYWNKWSPKEKVESLRKLADAVEIAYQLREGPRNAKDNDELE